MDRDQLERFRTAVEEKQAREKDRADAGDGHGHNPTDEEPARFDHDGADRETAIRDKSSRHGKVTADKWNQ